MKKSTKLVIAIATFFVAVFFVVWTYQSAILKYFLVRSVDKLSHGQMSLVVESIDYHPFSKSIKAMSLSIKTNDSVYDNTNNFSLKSLTFDSVVIQDFSLWKAVSSNVIKAGVVLTARPELIFKWSLNNIDTVASVESQLKFLSNYDPNTIIPMEFDIVKLKYGTIEYNSDSSGIPLGSADFSIELREFSTIENSLNQNSESFVFSKRIIIDVSNLSRKLKNARILRVEKIEFDSYAENLKISTASLSGIDTGVLDSLMINNIILNGISLKELGNIEHFKFNSILIDTSYLSIFPQRRNKLNTISYSKIADEIVNYIKTFKVDTINVNSLFVDGFEDDKLLFGISGLDFGLNNLMVDSNFIANNMLPDYTDLLFSIDSLRLFEKINVDANNINYSSSLSKLTISDFKHITNSLSDKITCKKIIVDDITLKNFLNNSADSNVYIQFIEPEITYYIRTNDNNSLEMNDNEFISNLLFRKIDIINAKLELNKINEFKVVSQNVNLKLKFKQNLALNSIDKSKYIEELLWNSGQTVYENQNKDVSINLSSSQFDNDDLLIKKGSFMFMKNNSTIEALLINWKEFNFTHFDFIKLLNEETINSSAVTLIEPQIDLAVNTIKNNKSGDNNEAVKLPIILDFHKINLKDGIFILEVKHEKYSQKLNSKFDIEFGKFYTDEFINLKKLLTTDIQSSFGDVNFTDENLSTYVEKLRFSTSDSTITLNNIDINGDSISYQSLINGDGYLKMDELILEDIHLSDIVNNDKFYFATLKVKNPNLNLGYEIDTNYLSERHHKGLIPVIDMFERLELSGFNLNLKHHKLKSDEYVSFDSTNISWQEALSNSSLDEIFLKMNNFKYNNEINNVEILVDNIYTDYKNDDVHIRNISFSKERNANSNGLTFNVPNLSIYDLLLNKSNSSELEINSFESDSIFLKIEKDANNSKSKFDITNIKNELSAVFSKLYVRDLKIENAGVQILNVADSISNLSELLNFRIKMEGFGYSQFDSLNAFPDYIKVNLKDNYFLTSDSLYEFKAVSVKYNFIDNSFVVDSISLKPTLNTKEYFKHFGYQIDMFNLDCKQIKGTGFNLDEYLENNIYSIDKIDFFNINTTIYRDKTYEFKHGIEKPMPAELIMKIQPSFSIDSVEIHNSRILYGEYANKSSEPGEVFFDDFNLSATNITNINSHIESNNNLEINVNTKLMGKPKLTADLNILLDNPDKFSFKGYTEEMDFSIFNSMTQNLFGISVIRGKGSFNLNSINASDSIAKGIITFKYKKLRIALYDREKAALNKGIASPFFNFLVNDLLIKSNNPRFIGSTRQGLVYFKRDTERSFLNYMWKSLVSGMMSTMWHNSKEQRIEKRRLNKIK